MQQSMLWWKVLFHEMGPPATKHSDPPLDSRAHRRSQSLVSLFNKLVETSNTLLLLEIGAHNADVSIEFVQANKLRQAFAYEASPTIYNKTVERNIPKQVNYINEAVGSSSGQLIFYEPLSGGYKSQ
ncbi:hypothetical protein, partial [uncultured Methylobacterium sp.]|uniref:hypothetical protein n=1 Tax=uncultured Methylobacterium sp. TaxID=157278 RepID=UPI0035CC2BE4